MGTVVTNTGSVNWNDPAADGERERLDRDRRHARRRRPERRGLARRRLRPTSRTAASARSRAGSSTCTATASPRAVGRHRRERRLPHRPASRRTRPTAIAYELRFRAPDAGANTAPLGRPTRRSRTASQRITDIVVPSGSNLQDLNLPIDPNGVVYDAIAPHADRGRDADAARRRAAARPSAAACFDDPRAAGPGHARRRLLQVRPELLRRGLSRAAATTCSRSRRPGSAFGTGVLADHSADDERRDRRRFASRPARAAPTTRCRPRPATARPRPSRSSRRRRRCRARTAGTNYHLHLTARRDSQIAGLEPDLQQPHPARSGARRRGRRSRRRRRRSTSARGQLVPYEITLNNEPRLRICRISRIVDRYPGRLPLRRGLRADRRRADRADRVERAASSPWSDLGVAALGSARSCSCCSRSARASPRASS